jgi:hypothetical protein
MVLIETQKEEFNRLKDIRILGDTGVESGLNGDLLVLGLGGLGTRVVCKLKGMLMDDIAPEDNISYMIMDSDIPAMEQTIEDSKEGLGMNAMEVVSIYRPNLATMLENGAKGNPKVQEIAKWMNPDFPATEIGTGGAKGNRQVGRLMFSNAYEDMRFMLFEKIEEMYEKSGKNKLDVIIVSGTAGGTGSGIISDVTYNIKAYAKSKKWKNFRIGACLLLPDVLFCNKSVSDNKDLTDRLNANSCATLKEIDYLMRVANRGEGYLFECGNHRLSMKENIFDSCMLVSGKKDEQGYIPEHLICSDVAYFLKKLASNKFIGSKDETGRRMLLRDTFFDHDGEGYFKVVNQADYKIPVKEIENICEYEMFKQAKELIYKQPGLEDLLNKDMENCLGELSTFLSGAPGDEVKLNINGLIRPEQYQKPAYKQIKKGMDDLRTGLPRQLSRIEQDVPVFTKSIKNKLCSSLDEYIEKYMHTYGPYITMYMIGSAGTGNNTVDSGMIVKLKSLEGMLKKYKPTGENARIVESILDIVAKRFFTFPSAKRETENGYFDASIKDALEKERTLIIDGIDSNDVIGDAIRLLRRRAEHLDEMYTSFGEDLENAVSELASQGDKTTGYLLKGNKRHEFLPSDYISAERIEEIRQGIVKLLVSSEADIDNGRPVDVKSHMEKIYKNVLMGLGAYAPEKLLAVSFADEIPKLQELNMMFVSPTNEVREDIMKRAAASFVGGVWEKTEKKKLCSLKDGYKDKTTEKKFISLPEAMPYFSQAVKDILMKEPYNESDESITMNIGELEISVDNIFTGVPLYVLECADDMQTAYDKADFAGLHTDENIKDMRSYPEIMNA